MNKDNIKAQMLVKDQVINVIRIDDKEFISLTDLARYADEDDPRYPIQKLDEKQRCYFLSRFMGKYS